MAIQKPTQTTTDTADFEFFEGTQSESSTRPQITVRRGGLLVLTQAAVDMLGKGVDYIQLGYNPKTRVIGIRAADEEAPGRYRLRSQKKSPSRLIGGKRFFNHHGLSVDRARTFEVEDFGNAIIGFRLAKAEANPKSTPVPHRKTKAA